MTEVDRAISDLLNEALCYRDGYGEARENAKIVMSRISALEAENKQIAECSRMLVTVSIQALERLSTTPTERTSYLLKRLDIAINGVQTVLANIGE